MAENVEYIPLRRASEFDDWDDSNIEETNDDDETTNILGNNNPEVNDDDNDSIYNWDPLENRGKDYNMISNERAVEVLNIKKFLNDVIVDYPNEYGNSKFIKYLMDKHSFQLRKTSAIEENTIDYEIGYYGKPVFDEDGEITRPAREFYTENGKFQTDSELEQFKGDLDYLYDKWKDEILKKKIKKAGLVGGVVLAIAGLVSGLSLGLKRSGHSMVHDSKVKWKKLTPAEKKQIVIPWTKLEEASGKSAILVGDYIYVLIGGTILVYALRK